MANSISHASLPYPIKNARFTLLVPYLDADGDPTDPTTPDTEVSQDGGAFADAAEEMTTISGSNGMGYITLSGAEMNNSAVGVAAKVASGPKATLMTLFPRNLAILESGTASAGAAGTITLASGTYTGLNLVGCFIRTTGGTGGGGTGGANNQARRITAYNTSTRVATVTPNWETTPDNTTTYDVLLPEGVLVPMLTALAPTTLGRTLDVSAGGEAGLDWANIGSPTTPQNLSGTTVSAVSGNVGGIGANGILSASFGTGAITAGAIAADAIGASELAADAVAEIADAIWDEARAGHVGAGTFGEGVASVQGSVTGSVVGAVGSIGVGGIAAASFDAGAINAAAIAADAIGASELAADAVAEIQSGLATSANQTTILDKLGAFTGSGVNTVLGFFKALLSKTASTPSDVGGTFDPATDSVEAIRDRGDAAWLTATGFSTLTQADVRAAVGLASANLDTQLGAIDDYLDTEVAAIKAKTDNLPSDPADQSAVEAAITAAQVAIIAEVDANETKIDIIDGVVDAIKLKTDNLPAAPAAVGDIPTTGEIADTVWGAQVIDNQTFGSFGAKVNEIHDDIQGLNDLSAAEAADAVWDEALSGHATAGSTGEALSNASAGGTPPTVGAIADAVWDEALGGHVGAGSTGKALSDIKAITDTLTSPSITVTSPVAAGGDVSMIAGYDYTDESGQTLTWTLEGAPDLTGATVDVVQIEPDADGNEVSYDWEVDVEDAGEATQTVRAQVTGAQTAALGEPGRVARHRFRIKATLANTAQVALVDATMTIT